MIQLGMSSEKQPDSQSQQDISEKEQAWNLKEGEMSEAQIRSLGQFLYLHIFGTPNMAVLDSLFEEHAWKSKSPEDFRVNDLPSEIYIQEFARLYGLNVDILKRWMSQASIELANEFLPVLPHQEKHHPIVETVGRVLHLGIATSIRDHRIFVEEAFKLDQELGSRYRR